MLLVNCNMEVLTDVQRHTFEREFDAITSTYLDNLAMDAESLLDHPICMELSEEELLSAGITPGFVRLSIGLEHTDDIIADFEQALSKI